ncbi:hypothetical protein [Pseudomonas koreensis]|uniref:hypothetical protein n=1 Tax=Pseudomonas koreensis TaxID=198620 RepID=UPI0012FD69BE|nr:hypothetical protein [Pseudomonas koreensis]
MYAGVAMGMLSLLEKPQPTGTIACPGAYSDFKIHANHHLAIRIKGLPAMPSRLGVEHFDKQKKVRKKLRSAVQLLAHLAESL